MGMLDLGRYKTAVLAIAGFLVFVAAILAINHTKVGRIADNTSAVTALARLQAAPRSVFDHGAAVAGALQAGEPIDEAIEALRKQAASYDQALLGLKEAAVSDGSGKSRVVPALLSPEAKQALGTADTLWAIYKTKLEPILRFSGSPYATETGGVEPAPSAPASSAVAATEPANSAAIAKPDGATSAVQYSPRGRRLQEALAELQDFGASSHEQLSQAVSALTSLVDQDGQRQARVLRLIQVGGLAAAVLLLGALFLYFTRSLRKEAQIVGRARKETADILRTVNEGLFLLDKDMKLGSERSLALNSIFRRDDFDNLTFDALLQQLVPDKTLKVAMDYVALLWGDRVNEKLVKTINPLSEVEVHFDNPAGGFDTHYLDFDFNRVKSAGSLSHLLVTVNDVTKRVMLSRELQESQEKAQAQLDLLLRILHVAPESLTGFLTDAEVSLKMVNAILKEPAREEHAFRAKIDGIYRQVHAVKGEAAALGLKTVEQRAHAFEESLSDMKSRPSLSGSDFLPLVVKLDDLFNHLAQVREMLARLMDLHQAIAARHTPSEEMSAHKVNAWLTGKHDQTMHMQAMSPAAAPAPAVATPGAAFTPAAPETGGGNLDRTLEELAQRIAGSQAKQVAVHCTGLDQVPDPYRRAIKDITIQLVRNAVVHGIESPEQRRQAHKAETGSLQIDFAPRGTDGFELIVQDDGRGLQLERIKEVAVERGLITTGQAAVLDPRQTMALIFRPGFSTASEVSSDAGRGAGMDLVRVLVAELGGRVGLASAGGRFSKFKIWLPMVERAAA